MNEGFTTKRFEKLSLNKSPIRLFVWDTNESRVAKIVDFDYYGNYYITEISERNSELILHIQSEI